MSGYPLLVLPSGLVSFSDTYSMLICWTHPRIEGMLWAMLIVWLAQGRPRYVSQEGSIAYISDVGASGLKPLFIAGCAITALCFFLTLVVARVLRHTGR